MRAVVRTLTNTSPTGCVGLITMPVNKPIPKHAAPEGGSKKPIIAIAVLVVVAVVAFMINRKVINPPPEKGTVQVGTNGVFAAAPTKSPTAAISKPVETRGAFAADEALQIIGNAGTVAIVLDVNDPKFPNTPDMARFLGLISTEVDAFKDRLQQKGKFTFAPELRLPRPDGAQKTVWPAGSFTKLLQSHPASTTLVFFCYLPETLTDVEKNNLRTRSGKVIVAAGAVPEVKPYVDERLVHLAVASKMPIPPATGTGPETPGQWVRRVHAVLKP